MEKLILNPTEITEKFIETGSKKISNTYLKTFILGILAGAFIAFASEGSTVAVHTIASVGIAKTLAGALFTTGLMMVVITGAELFTGNTLIVVSCLDGKARWVELLKNWFLVYSGNLLGSLLIVVFIFLSGQLDFSKGALGAFTIKTAVYKVNLTFTNAFIMGILANWLVCMAVWMSVGAFDVSGKLFAMFFPIWLFVTSGFEHSIANMYYIPAGILAKSNQAWVNTALSMGLTPSKIDSLNWFTFITRNLIPVTLGNIVGGAFFVGFIYWFSFKSNNAGRNISSEPEKKAQV